MELLDVGLDSEYHFPYHFRLLPTTRGRKGKHRESKVPSSTRLPVVFRMTTAPSGPNCGIRERCIREWSTRLDRRSKAGSVDALRNPPYDPERLSEEP